MNDRIAQMAREAELIEPRDEWDALPKAYTDAIIKLIGLVAEDCAKFVEPDAEHRRHPHEYLGDKEGIALLDGVAKALRARYSTPNHTT